MPFLYFTNILALKWVWLYAFEQFFLLLLLLLFSVEEMQSWFKFLLKYEPATNLKMISYILKTRNLWGFSNFHSCCNQPYIKMFFMLFYQIQHVLDYLDSHIMSTLYKERASILFCSWLLVNDLVSDLNIGNTWGNTPLTLGHWSWWVLKMILFQFEVSCAKVKEKRPWTCICNQYLKQLRGYITKHY